MRKQKGFTLIELMIVVAILGILFSIIVGENGSVTITSNGASVNGASTHDMKRAADAKVEQLNSSQSTSWE